MTYEYAKLDDTERQYDHLDLSEQKVVDAVYVPSSCTEDKGNPFIEALPRPRTRDELIQYYDKPLSQYNWEQQLSLTPFNRMKSAMQLRNVRFVLPFMSKLQEDFALMLINSYRCRSLRKKSSHALINDESLPISYVSDGRLGGTTNAGLSLIGYSGCGKTSAMSMVLSDYPQVILHHPNEHEQFTQIVYLYVVCPVNSNFTVLFNSIGHAIDSALGNSQPVYQEMVRKCKSVGAMASKVSDLLDLFNVGALIFDEIQLLDFEGNRESTFESLLTVVNNTKVALVVLGTEDAYQKMFPNLRMARRVGANIEASQYCRSLEFFAHICKKLFRYQWFNKPVELSEDMIETLYSLTYGIIDQLVSLYIYMNIAAIRSTKPIEVTTKFIDEISETYYPGLRQLIEKLRQNQASIAEFERQRQLLSSEADSKVLAQFSALECEETMAEIIRDENSKSVKNHDQLFRNVVQNAVTALEMSGEDFPYTMVEKAVRHIMSLKKNNNADEKSLTRQTCQWLKREKPEKRVRKGKPVMDPKHIEIQNMLKIQAHGLRE